MKKPIAKKTLWDKYETDPRKEGDGVAVEFDGVTFYIRRAGGGNRAYRYALAEASRPYAHLWAADPRDPKALYAAQEEIQRAAFSQTVLVGWSDNMVDRMGDPLPFSIEAAFDLLRSCPEIFDFLKGEAISNDRFKPDQEGELLGKSSHGGASGAHTSTA